MGFNLISLLITLCSGGIPASGAFASCADLALVLAIDGSGSIDDHEFALQRSGYALAFSDRRVTEALASAGIVDIAVVIWGDGEMSAQVIPWRRVENGKDAGRLSGLIATTHRKVTGNTGIGNGLWTALDLLDQSEICAARKIINVSGDGSESRGTRSRNYMPLTEARRRAEEMGVTVNGLAIKTDERDLEAWYRDRVILGPGAFVMSVTSFEAFGEAIIRKLEREISLPNLAQLEIRTGGKP